MRKNTIVLLVLALLAGCRRVPEPKTMLLPEEETEQGIALEGEEGDRYAVRKMYSEDYEAIWYGGYTAFLPGTGEHQVRLAESGTDGLRVRTLDYRYGFYEQGLLPVGELMASLGIAASWEMGTEDEQNMEAEFFSPDGRYILYIRTDQSYIGSRLYLMDLESGTEELLLDGDEGVYPVDHFMILTAWSRDSSILCYGFYPRDASVWDNYMGEKFLLYFRDMETGEIVNRLNYYYSRPGGEGKSLEGTRLYVDHYERKLLTATVLEQEEEMENYMETGNSLVNFFAQEIPRSGMETEGVVLPEVANCPRDTRLYLDAESDCIYFISAGEGIISLNLEEGSYTNTMPIGPAKGIRDFCVLDGGKAFVVAEYDLDHVGEMGPQDICLYTMEENDGISSDTEEMPNMTRRVLYQNAGYVIRLQYDPTYRRLLAETGIPDLTAEIKNAQVSKNSESNYRLMWDPNRRALILEF